MLMYLGGFMVMMFSSMLLYSIKRKHLLIMLLALEFMVVGMFLGLSIYMNYLNFENFFCLIYLTMSVCEGVLGLSVLVLMIRTHGNDYIMSLSILW
uniref:NADH-ubiquinone oxidoreductase chain 4L n=1 Tax=Cerambycidae sp. 4 KM-2017 TaxID=2219289 RepID=A0A346RGA6_9CUCU|nr:NADH dehydrogenase subunit 4L [Cerambycidae sp. 4 KM-2017]